MNSLQELTTSVNKFDKAAALAADERLDADRGRELMRQMDARHFEQGYIAGQMGLTPSKASLWSPAHHAGHQAAVTGRPVIFALGGTPAMLREVAA